MDQHWSGIPKEKQIKKEELRVSFSWSKPSSKRNHIEPELNFNISEDESVSHEGVLYYIPGKMHYYFNFGLYISKIYRDDELDQLMSDINIELSNRMGVDELRNIKLINLGVS